MDRSGTVCSSILFKSRSGEIGCYHIWLDLKQNCYRIKHTFRPLVKGSPESLSNQGFLRQVLCTTQSWVSCLLESGFYFIFCNMKTICLHLEISHIGTLWKILVLESSVFKRLWRCKEENIRRLRDLWGWQFRIRDDFKEHPWQKVFRKIPCLFFSLENSVKMQHFKWLTLSPENQTSYSFSLFFSLFL